MSQIPTLIKRLRAAPHGLSQSEIARKTGIPQPRMSQWESGKVPAGADDALKLVAFARVMGVQLHEETNDPIFETQLVEAAKAGVIERRDPAKPGRRDRDIKAYAALAAAGQGT